MGKIILNKFHNFFPEKNLKANFQKKISTNLSNNFSNFPEHLRLRPAAAAGGPRPATLAATRPRA